MHRLPKARSIAALWFLAVAACGGEKTAPTACIPGQQLECACPGSVKGIQVCLSNGSGFDVCACGGGSGSGGAGAAGAGASGASGSNGSGVDAATPGQDAASEDSSADVQTPSDAPPSGDAPADSRPTADMGPPLDATILDVSWDVAPPRPDTACAGGAVLPAQKRQIDLYMMIDNSGSMDMVDTGQTLSRWDNLAQAIPTFVNDPVNAGMEVGVDFFPEGGLQASCNVTDYTMANVPIDFLPGTNNAQANAIVTAVQGRARSGGTPTVPALTGALQAAKAWQMQNPQHALSVLFLTDGQPTGCQGNTVNAAAAVAQMYSTGIPPIKTYVLGVGPDTGNLDSIAAAGGSTMAYMVTNGGAGALAAALAAIRKSTVGCEYNIPLPEGGTVDPTKINVQITIGPAGTPQGIYNVATAAGCGTIRNPTGEGWYYDVPPPAAPTQIRLCPNSCSPLQVTDGSAVNVVYGCSTQIPPPPI